jgi:DNA-binding NarL/FixJ family response regulator
MPIKGGVAATREITLAQPSTQVLVLTTLDDDETVFEAVRAGAQAYLLKDVSEEELLETIRALSCGESRLTAHIARKVMDQFQQLARAQESWNRSTNSACAAKLGSEAPGDRSVVTVGLTDEEKRVLGLITNGSSNRQIAHAMALAEGTVKNYVARIMEKLHANTRTELAIQMNPQRRGG